MTGPVDHEPGGRGWQALRYKASLILIGIVAGMFLRAILPPAKFVQGPVAFEPMPEEVVKPQDDPVPERP